MNKSILLLVLVFVFSTSSYAVDLESYFDLSGNHHIALEIPVSGLSYNAKAILEYKKTGQSTYLRGPDLNRVRVDLDVDSYFKRTDAFAGAVWGLTPGTSYDVKVTITDGSNSTIYDTGTKPIATRQLAPETKNQSATHIVNSSNASSLQTILDNAKPGDIIEIQGNLQVGELYLKAQGSASKPIFLRGKNGTLTNPTGSRILEARGSHWVVEDLNLFVNQNDPEEKQVVRVRGYFEGHNDNYPPVVAFTLRRSHIKGIKGLSAKESGEGDMRNLSIYDNTFEGRWSHPKIVELKKCKDDSACTGPDIKATWDDTGMKMTGEGHSVFNNTIFGFGDSIKNSRESVRYTKSNHYHHNKILWGGDDGIELDDAMRNTIASDNLIMNTGTGVSKQPNKKTGGPNYAVRNVIVNFFLRPFKLNDGPNGVNIIHNTVVDAAKLSSPELLWAQYGGALRNFKFFNNLFVKTASYDKCRFIYWTPNFRAEAWDGNGYFPEECSFYIDKGMDNLAEAQARAGEDNNPYPSGYNGALFESLGISLNLQPFAAGISQFGTSWENTVQSVDARLDNTSPAANAKLKLNGFNSKSIGAINYGEPMPIYGVRTGIKVDVLPPRQPAGLSVK